MSAFAFLNEYLNDTLKTPEDVLQYLNLPVIGMIGEMDEGKGKKTNQELNVFVAENPLSPVTEAFRTLRTNLDFASVDRPIKTLLVTSTSPSEGKSTVAVNLSAVMAQGGKKVVLVDTDLRRPSIHSYLHLPNRKGLSDLFRNQTKLSNAILTWGTPPIAVLTSGALPPNPTELLASKEMERIINDLTNKSDIVIVDSPPAIVADPVALSAKVDGVLLVIEPGKTRIDAAQVVLEQFQRAGARVVGVVLNPISRKRAHYYTKYQYYSSYYYTRGYSRYFGGNGAFKGRRKGKHQREEVHEAPVEQTQSEP
jgi:non-specific protein-tyrosine kinase